MSKTLGRGILRPQSLTFYFGGSLGPFSALKATLLHRYDFGGVRCAQIGAEVAQRCPK